MTVRVWCKNLSRTTPTANRLPEFDEVFRRTDSAGARYVLTDALADRSDSEVTSYTVEAAVDWATIALWLGHERFETTRESIEADLALKEAALQETHTHRPVRTTLQRGYAPRATPTMFHRSAPPL
jgi:hypothetical protein